MIILSQFAIGRTALTLYNKSVRCAYGFVCLLHAGCKSADLRAPWDSRCAQLCHEKVADAQSRVARTPVRTGTLRVKARMAYGQDAHGTARAYALRASVHGAHPPAVDRERMPIAPPCGVSGHRIRGHQNVRVPLPWPGMPGHKCASTSA